ncbi:MAG TPA: ASKHA domain-containing protein [Clostridiales bacterium]|nr:ASKHA domain-containing protein [Clostridiales bacterium]
MAHTVRIHTINNNSCNNIENIENFYVENGKNLLDFLREKSLYVPTPCGGKGTCGKCRVKVKGYIEEPSEKEKKLLGRNAEAMGYRLACYNKIESDIDIFLDNSDKEASIVTSGIEKTIKVNPLIGKKCVKLDMPDIHDQRPDVDRIIEAYDSDSVVSSIDLIADIPELIRKEYTVTVVSHDGEITGVEPGNTENRLYGIAVDIGTTTIAAYLYNLGSGKKLDTYSTLNPQRKYGADVLSRIEYTNNSVSSKMEMHKVIIDCVNKIVDVFAENNSIEKNDIYSVVFAGNTTMIHFLMNLPAKNIALSPFIPVTTNMHKIHPSSLGININNGGLVIILPSVSAYIGADTVAAVLSSNMHKSNEIYLLIDIGTNGEIVLGNKDWMYSCSTAAGPAFEGANIRNGIGGIKGAVDKIHFNNKLEIETIGSEKAIGICGSGIVDAVAGMLDKGIIDETGRIIDNYIGPGVSEGEVECEGKGESKADNLEEDYKERFVKIEGLNSFLLIKSEESGIDNDIVINQKDVREIQNAKAAIAAGIKVLVKQAGISWENIAKVCLAGGFGNYINTKNALKIGLLPAEIAEEKIVSIGNAAGAGAVEGLLSRSALEEMEIIKDKIKYIELSAMADFVDEYVDCMFFENINL